MKYTKLELTWFGKGENNNVEPRILLEDKNLSNTILDPNTDNMLIHGDNLLALKALENEFTGKIKCVYIDPPFNTGSRINADGTAVGYDDGIEHSTWLNMMYIRLDIIHNLLSEDGALFIHLDDNESDYCKVILDEIFGRQNFMNRITVDARSPSAFSTVNPGMFVASEHILYYAKNRAKLTEKRIKTVRTPDSAYDKFIINFDDNYENWEFKNVFEVFAETQETEKIRPDRLLNKYYDFVLKNANKIIRFTAISDSGAGKNVVELKYQSQKEPNKIFRIERENYDDIYVMNGQQIAFYGKNVSTIDGKLVATKMLTDIWTDIAWEGIAGEGKVTFKKGKKPEKLLRRCIDLVTEEGDIVLDSFLGSGTTAAVAHKMKRKWIGIEMGDHAYTHSKERIDNVISGADKTGISKFVNWNGGGGYKFYELAPTLIKKDRFGCDVINPEYNAEMLAAAVCKHENFKYNPDPISFWKQAKNDNTYIYVTTQHISAELLQKIHLEMKEEENLLVVSKSFDEGVNKLFKNISVKKIPQSLLGKCEYGKDNYNLNIISLPEEEGDNE